jgi:hypothetical protein
MKSATSAREIFPLIVLSVLGKPWRYMPVRFPFVKAPGRTIVQSRRLSFVICVRSTQEEPKHDVLPEEIQIGPTVPDAEG